MFRILTNTFINEYQRRKRHREVLDAATAEQGATDGVLAHEGSSSQMDPEQALLTRSVSDDVSRALAELPDEFRIAVVLCDVEGFTYKEIADLLECPVGTVMSRLHRGRKLLKLSLHSFAVAQGFVREAGEATIPAPSEAAAGTIDLASWRRLRSK
jgi:RNA polymerase sigma-70 factor (ECF subfamily)